MTHEPVRERKAFAQPSAIHRRERTLIEWVNGERTAAGVQIVNPRRDLLDKADAWAAHLATIDRLEHSRLTDSVAAPWTKLGEVVGVVRHSSELRLVHDAFQRSPDHRPIIVDPTYEWIGIGIASRGDATFIVEVFGRSRPLRSPGPH